MDYHGKQIDLLQCSLISGNTNTVRILLDLAGTHYPIVEEMNLGDNIPRNSLELNPTCMKIYKSWLKKQIRLRELIL